MNSNDKHSIFNSTEYWQNRYEQNGHSGLGSRGLLAQFKADTINAFIKENKIKSLIEYGVGDGHNLSLIKCKKITGLDVSDNALNRCKELMPKNKFYNISEPIVLSADLCVSLDVIYHLVEDDIYNEYMFKLSQMSLKYIIIYSSNFDSNEYATHVKPRKFTDHPALNDFELIKTIPNKYPSNDHKTGSFSDFYLYKRI